MQNHSTPVHLQAKWDALRHAGDFIVGINALLRLTGRLKVHHQERFPREPEPLLVIANHPSYFVETIVLLPGLFARWYMRDIRHAAWNVPDRDNFRVCNHRFLSWSLLRTIFMPRNGKGREKKDAVRQIIEGLNAGESVILFPEGGRTSSGDSATLLYSPVQGKPMRPLQGGLARLVLKTKARVLPIWVEGTDKFWPRKKLLPRPWHKMSLIIGEPMDFSELRNKPGRDSRQEICQVATDALLALADLPACNPTASVLAQAGAQADETA